MDPSSPNYLLQTLTNVVYIDPDPRTYPLSSYCVYMIEPTGGLSAARRPIPARPAGKRQSIADFEYYSICQGQSQIGGREDIRRSPSTWSKRRSDRECRSCSRQIHRPAPPPTRASTSTNLNINTCNEPDLRAGPAQRQLPDDDRSPQPPAHL